LRARRDEVNDAEYQRRDGLMLQAMMLKQALFHDSTHINSLFLIEAIKHMIHATERLIHYRNEADPAFKKD
jgi:hypothetical protein